MSNHISINKKRIIIISISLIAITGIFFCLLKGTRSTLTLAQAQKAIISTARAFNYRKPYLQYEKNKVNANQSILASRFDYEPEELNSQNVGYDVCGTFVSNVYYATFKKIGVDGSNFLLTDGVSCVKGNELTEDDFDDEGNLVASANGDPNGKRCYHGNSQMEKMVRDAVSHAGITIGSSYAEEVIFDNTTNNNIKNVTYVSYNKNTQKIDQMGISNSTNKQLDISNNKNDMMAVYYFKINVSNDDDINEIFTNGVISTNGEFKNDGGIIKSYADLQSYASYRKYYRRQFGADNFNNTYFKHIHDTLVGSAGILETGDVVLFRRYNGTKAKNGTQGHVYVYDKSSAHFFHSSADSYKFSSKKNALNDAVGTMRYYSTDMTFGAKYGLSRSNVYEILVLRPLNLIISEGDYTLTENASERYSMPYLFRTKTASVNEHESVNVNDKITYTFELADYYNCDNDGKTDCVCETIDEKEICVHTYTDLTITDTIPKGTQYDSCTGGCSGPNSEGEISWKGISVSNIEPQTFSYTVTVLGSGSSIVNDSSKVAGVKMNKIETTVNKTLSKEKQEKLVEVVNSLKGENITGGSAQFVQKIYNRVLLPDLGFDFSMTTPSEIFGEFFKAHAIQGVEYYDFDDSNENENVFKKMYVKGLYGGRNVWISDDELLKVGNGDNQFLASTLGEESREIYFDINSLMIGDVVLVYDKEANKERGKYLQAPSDETLLQIADVIDLYLYIGNGNFAAAVNPTGSSDISIITIFDNKVAGTERSRFIDALYGQNAFVVLRPSYAYQGENVNAVDKAAPKFTIVSDTRSIWQKTQTFTFKLYDDKSWLENDTYRIKYMTYGNYKKPPTCEQILENGTSLLLRVTDDLKTAISDSVTISDVTSRYLAWCDEDEIRDMQGNQIGSSYHSGWKMYTDASRPVLEIVSDTNDVASESQAFKIQIKDAQSGLKAGTYTIKYAYGDANSNYDCNSAVMNTNSVTFRVETDGVTSVASNEITVDSGQIEKIYLCNVDELKDVVDNKRISAITEEQLLVDGSLLNLKLSKTNSKTGITYRLSYKKQQTFSFDVSSTAGFKGGSYKIYYKLYRKNDPVPDSCSGFTDYVTLDISEGKTGTVYSSKATITDGNYDYIAYCNDYTISDHGGYARLAETLSKNYKMYVDNEGPGIELINESGSRWSNNQKFSFRLYDNGSGLKAGNYKIKYMLYNGIVPNNYSSSDCRLMNDYVTISVNSDGIAEVISDSVTIERGNYRYIDWCGEASISDVVGNSLEQDLASGASEMYVDNTDPSATISTPNTLKTNSQTVTLYCQDESEIDSYAWTTASSYELPEYIPAPEEMKNGSGVVETVTSDGTYYLYCKDGAGNVSDAEIQFSNYTVNNRVAASNANIGEYNNENYVSNSKNTYLAKTNTVLPLTGILTVPNSVNSQKLAGVSLGEAEESESTLLGSSLVLRGNATYTTWFDPNVVNIQYNLNGGVLAESDIYTSDTDGYILRDGSRVLQTVAYDSSLDEDGLYDYNGSGFNITRDGYFVGLYQWCLDASGSGNCYKQNKVYNASDFCDISSDDCVITLYLNWKSDDEPGEVEIDFNDLIVNTENSTIERVLPGTTVLDIKNSIDTTGTLKVIDSDNNILPDDHITNINDRLVITYNDEEFVYNLSILGDINKDGFVNRTDIFSLIEHILDTDDNNENILLGDINNDGVVKMNDIIAILKRIN